MTRVSDEERQNLSYEVSDSVSDRAWEAWELMHAELLALRRVADAAIGISVSMSAHTGGRWNTLRTAIHEAGL